jgi:AcrR family transcriptional regulator
MKPMPSRGRQALSARPYHHGDLRNALIAQGLALLEEAGLAGLSLRAIAARAGVSHAAPKNHFGHLRGLLTAIAAEGFRRHVVFMRDGLPKRAGRPARLAAAMRGYVRFAQVHPHLFSLMFSNQHCDFADPELAEASAASYGVLREIAAGLDWDKADSADAGLRAEMMLWSMVHGFAQLQLNGRFQGAPALLVTDVMPVFGYRDDAR